MFETDMEGYQELNIRPLKSGYWVNVNRSHVTWEDAPGMTTEGRRTRRDLPYELYSDFTQHAIGEDGQEVSVRWGFNFIVDENGNWIRREDNLDVSASHS
jgi:hypothetical protein